MKAILIFLPVFSKCLSDSLCFFDPLSFFWWLRHKDISFCPSKAALCVTGPAGRSSLPLKVFTQYWLNNCRRKMVWAVEFCMKNSAAWIFFSFSFPITLPMCITCRIGVISGLRPKGQKWSHKLLVVVPNYAGSLRDYLGKRCLLFCCWKWMSWGHIYRKKFEN